MEKPLCTVLLHTYHHEAPEAIGFLAYSLEGTTSKYGLFGTMHDAWTLVAHLAYLDRLYNLRFGLIEIHKCYDPECRPCLKGQSRVKYLLRGNLQ